VAAARPAIKEKSAVTKAQRNKAQKLVTTVESLLGELVEKSNAVQDDKYKDEVPATLVGKIQVAIASLKEQQASLSLLLSDGWAGNAAENLTACADAVKKASDCKSKVQFYLNNADV
jgi:hypothetical protein